MAVCSDARGAALKGGRHRARVLTTLVGALAAVLAASQVLVATSSIPQAAWVAPRVQGLSQRVGHRDGLALRAEEGDVAVADAPAVEEASEAKAPAENTPLFQEMFISNKTTPKALMGAMVAIFSKGERAVDLVLIDPRSKHTPVYAVAMLPESFKASASVQMRRRDRRLRIRVFQQNQPQADPEPEVLKIAKTTDANKLGGAIKSKFVDAAGNNLGRTVKLEFQGTQAAAQALLAIENAGRLAFRELAFQGKFVEREAEEGAEEGSKQVYLSVDVTVF